jgi:hypothetical protein
MFVNISINRDTGNLNTDPIYYLLLTNEPVFNTEGIKILQNHLKMRLNTRPKIFASVIANNRIISQ